MGKMANTKFERIDSGRPDTAVFKVTGRLGFHENGKIKRLVDECLKRDFKHVVFDLSEVSSLGGGVAKIFREFVRVYEEKGNEVKFVVVKDVVNEFLQDESMSLKVHRSLEEALGSTGPFADDGSADSGSSKPTPGYVESGEDMSHGLPESEEVKCEADEENKSKDSHGEESSSDEKEEKGGEEKNAAAGSSDVDSNIILMSYDNTVDTSVLNDTKVDDVESKSESANDSESVLIGETKGPSDEPTDITEASQASNARDDSIISEIFDSSKARPPEWIENPVSPFEGSKTEETPAKEEPKSDLNKQLKRRILELKTLFSISEDFNAIRDKRKLMDIFLLTSIAEGGVESALFFENLGDNFTVSMYKGVDEATARALSFKMTAPIKIADERILSIDEIPIGEDERNMLKREGLEFACPFNAGEKLTGFVILGRRFKGRGMKDEDFEFLKILVNVARGAYENALMFEREHERTLGIVKTLISLIEENTLLKGTSELVSRYVGMVAKGMGYPDEYFKDLIYGTVLRDMGMITVSDLILRSPRELTKEEWEIIKRHPEDGARMLERMKFSDHVIEIVKTHHERFNGEGYPYGLRGREIPLGSRIISVVESYAAMIHERPNRPAFSELEAIETLKENYGLRYDREVVDVFSKVIEKELARSAEKERSLT